MDRRGFLAATGCAFAATAAGAAPISLMPDRLGDAFARAIDACERASGGRLGLVVIDTGSGERFAHRADARFAMCSTFKFALAAQMLARVDAGRERLERRLAVPRAAIVSNSPFCEARAGGSASIAELCHATITVSDNAAANLLLATIGGPAGFTRQLRDWGDAVTRLDRWETAMGEGTPGDPRDTTTPAAMAALAQRLVLGSVLRPNSRARLTGWMRQTKTSRNGLRAGLPAGWQVADKTGRGTHGNDNDVAVLWPPRRPPLILASFLAEGPREIAAGRALQARIGRALARAYA